ncbi:MAG: hypothetical protein GXP46_07730 [Deferribacteres bacterium]|nr:hypothetical protein [Deferribacteres bacterium]
MKRLKLTFFVLSSVVVAILLVAYSSGTVYASSAHGESSSETVKEEVPFDRPVSEIKKYLAPMNELEMFPCSDCHDEEWETDYTRRKLDEPHNEIPGEVVNHDKRWCLDCHSAKQRDKLRLINGKLVDFNEYYKVCEQCHGNIYRQWKMGIHGKRTGYWNGEKQYMHCTQCHNPHNPPFKPIKPMPAPRKPLKVRLMKGK